MAALEGVPFQAPVRLGLQLAESGDVTAFGNLLLHLQAILSHLSVAITGLSDAVFESLNSHGRLSSHSSWNLPRN